MTLKTKLFTGLLCLAASWASAGIVNDTQHKSEVTRIMTFGDSLTYGYSLQREETYTANLSRMTGKYLVNQGYNGLTSQQAVDWHLNNALNVMPNPEIVIITLGGNDIVVDQRRTPEIKENLKQVFQAFQDRGAMVVFAAIDPASNWRKLKMDKSYLLPIVWGRNYGQLNRLAKDMGVVVVPKLLDGIWGNDQLTIPNDNFHPNAQGHRVMADRIYNVLKNHLPNGSGSTSPDVIKVEAEDFIMASADSTPGNLGGACSRRKFPDVDFEYTSDFGGGCNLSFVTSNESITLRANVKKKGDYRIKLRLASYAPTRAKVFVNDRYLATIHAPAKGWQTFENIDAGKTFLQSGAHDVRIEFIDGEMNFNYITLYPAN